MESFPVFLKLREQACLVIGGGEVATRKIQQLLRANAQITVVAPEISAALQELVANQQIQCLLQFYEASLLDNYTLVIAATNDAPLNEMIPKEARQHKC